MKEFFKGNVFKAVICLVALVLGMIIYQAASGNYASLPEAAVGIIVSPVVNVSAKISDSVAGFFNSIVNAKDVEKENKQLKSKMSDLYKKLSDYEKCKKENEDLKEFLEIKELNPDYKMENASVIGRDNSFNFGSFTVNKGSLNGIKVSDTVITSDGLVGIISHVGPNYSVVTTVLDESVNIGIYNSRTQTTGVLSGTAELSIENKTKLKLLPRDTTLETGDVIETSGVGGIYPSGIIIGTIESVKAETTGVSMYAVINPVVDIEKISNVVIITDFLGKEKNEKQ